MRNDDNTPLCCSTRLADDPVAVRKATLRLLGEAQSGTVVLVPTDELRMILRAYDAISDNIGALGAMWVEESDVDVEFDRSMVTLQASRIASEANESEGAVHVLASDVACSLIIAGIIAVETSPQHRVSIQVNDRGDTAPATVIHRSPKNNFVVSEMAGTMYVTHRDGSPAMHRGLQRPISMDEGVYLADFLERARSARYNPERTRIAVERILLRMETE